MANIYTRTLVETTVAMSLITKLAGVLANHTGIMQLVYVAHRITRTREDAEDAVQDALLSAFVHMADFEGRSSIGTWLTRIAVNSALMILRKKRATRETAMGDSNDLGHG